MQRTSRTLFACGPLLHPARDTCCVAFATKRQGAGRGIHAPRGSGSASACRWHKSVEWKFGGAIAPPKIHSLDGDAAVHAAVAPPRAEGAPTALAAQSNSR